MDSGMVTFQREPSHTCQQMSSLGALSEHTVVNELVRGPVAGLAAARTQLDLAHLGELEELQARLVNSLARAIALGKVVHDGAVVAARPLGPLQRDLSAGSNLDGLWRVLGV